MGIQLLYKPSAIFTATLGMICLWFCVYASYALGTLNYVPIMDNATVTEIISLQTIWIVPALMYFLIGIAALSTFNLFAAIFSYATELRTVNEEEYSEERSDFAHESWDKRI